MFGEQHSIEVEEELDSGPKRNRNCTDMLCCIIFILFWILTGYITITQIYTADYTRIARPYDSDGNACGFENTKDFPFLFFAASEKKNNDRFTRRSICVKECPSSHGELSHCHVTTYWKKKGVSSCSQLKRYPTRHLWNRYCMPEASKTSTRLIRATKSFTRSSFQNMTESIYEAKFYVLISIGISFGLCFLYSFLLEYCTYIVVFTSVVAFYAGSLYLSYLTFRKNLQLKKEAREDDDENTKEESAGNFYKWMSFLIWIILIIMSLIICCFFTRINLAIKIIMAAADFVTDFKSIILVPLGLMAAITVFLCYWAAAFAALYSHGELKYREELPFAEIYLSKQQVWLSRLSLFSLLWTLAFLYCSSQFIIASSASIWYFSGHKADIPNPILKSIWWLIRYHCGSIAFGSILLALVWVVQILASYLHKKLKEAPMQQMTVWISRCLGCLLVCLEKFVKFLNKHAFVEVALRSTNFCKSASNGMSVVGANVLRFGTLHGLGEIVMFFASVFISTAATILSYYLMDFSDLYSEEKQVAMFFPLLVNFF